MKKEIIYIGLEFIFGPIQKLKEDEDGMLITGINVIDNDKLITDLDKKINNIWLTLWSNNDSEASGMYFDSKKEKELAPILLDLISQLLNRLEQINDGTFEIEDMISEHLKSLILK